MGWWGSKPPQSCGIVWNMKSSLINHRSLSCVSINIQSVAEKLFESYNSFTTEIHSPYTQMSFVALNTCHSHHHHHHHQPVFKPNWEWFINTKGVCLQQKISFHIFREWIIYARASSKRYCFIICSKFWCTISFIEVSTDLH